MYAVLTDSRLMDGQAGQRRLFVYRLDTQIYCYRYRVVVDILLGNYTHIHPSITRSLQVRQNSQKAKKKKGKENQKGPKEAKKPNKNQQHRNTPPTLPHPTPSNRIARSGYSSRCGPVQAPRRLAGSY